MFSQSRMCLSGVSYNGPKRHIVVRFSNSGRGASFRYGFYPKAHFHPGPRPGALKDFFSENGLRGIVVCEGGGVATVTAQDFSVLTQACHLAGRLHGAQYCVLAPERQFLIEKGWDYFDFFELGKAGPVPLGSFEFPDARLGFFSGSLEENISSLCKSDMALAFQTAQKMAFSRLLKIPLSQEAQCGPARAFLENVAFSSSVPILKPADAPAAMPSTGACVDFSGLLCLASSMPGNNLGFESLDCNCCRPPSADAKNVLASSTVKVRFLREGPYFNSVSSAWAEKFHFSMPSKDAREQRKEEYCYSSYPCGPFCRGQVFEVLLADAKRLQEGGEAEILSIQQLHWVCTLRESALSAQINSLRKGLESVFSAAEREKDLAITSGGLLYYTSASGPCPLYRSALSAIMSEILPGTARLLCSRTGGFFSPGLGLALECISAGICQELEQAAASSGHCRLNPGFARVLCDPEQAHPLFRSLSSIYGAGKPYIRLGAGPSDSPF